MNQNAADRPGSGPVTLRDAKAARKIAEIFAAIHTASATRLAPGAAERNRASTTYVTSCLRRWNGSRALISGHAVSWWAGYRPEPMSPQPIDVGTKLRCPHCGSWGSFTSDSEHHRIQIDHDVGGGQYTTFVGEIRAAQCPNSACGKWVIDEVNENRFDNGSQHEESLISFRRLYPELPHAREVNAMVPDAVASFVREASQIQQVSPRAAASLLRHCLEAVLVENGYGKAGEYLNDLMKKAEADAMLPRSLIAHFQLLQQIGGFGSHAMGLPVESVEVDQLFESIDAAFDAFYIHPRKLADATKNVNEKLASINRKPMKDPNAPKP